MKLRFKNFAPAVVLGVICLVVAALLATINHFTAQKIADNERIARTESLTKAFPENSGVQFDSALSTLPEGAAKSVLEIYPELSGNGYAVTLEFQGYADKIGLTVGVDKDGKVAGVVVTQSNETKGKSEMYDAVSKLAGKSESDVSGVTLVTGATYSSNHIKDAVKDALAAAKLAKEQGLTLALTSSETDLSTDEGIAEKTVEFGMENLIGAQSFREVDLTGKDFYYGIKKIYEETTGKGYAVFFRTKTQYVPRECDVVMALDENFKIVNLEILYWSLSPSYQEEVQIFIDNPAVIKLQDSFKGNDITDVGEEVDLVSKATSTSYNIYNSVVEVLDYLDDIEEKIFASARAYITDAEGFNPAMVTDKEAGKGVKRIYEETSGKGYVVFCQTATQYNPDETRFVLVLDAKYDIIGVDLWRWTTGVYEGGAFPTSDGVKALMNSIKNTNITSLGTSVDLISGATSTSYNVYNAVTAALDFFTLEKIDSYVKEYAKANFPGTADADIVLFTPAVAPRKGAKLIYEIKNKGYVVYCQTATQYNYDETRFVFALDTAFNVTDVDIWRWSTGVYESATFPSSDNIDKLTASLIGVGKTTFTDKADLIAHATGTSGNVMAAVAEAIDVLDSNLENYILTFGASVLEVNKTDFTPVDISEAGRDAGIRRIYRENTGKGYVIHAVTKTQYNPMETEFVFVLSKNMRVLDFDLWFWSTGTYDGMTPTDSPKVDLLEKSFVGVTDLNIDYRVDLVSNATGTTNNVKAVVLEAINYLGTPSDTNLWQTVGIVVLCLGVLAIGVGLYTQRRRRI